jgi:hypothetical protein
MGMDRKMWQPNKAKLEGIKKYKQLTTPISIAILISKQYKNMKTSIIFLINS